MAALAMFAVAGVFSLFAYAVGLLQFTSPRRLARRDQADLRHLGRGPARDEGELQILYANEAYMELCGARDVSGICRSSGCSPGRPKSPRPSTDWRKRREADSAMSRICACRRP